jgi:predicted RNase H-like HicB family nuclease
MAAHTFNAVYEDAGDGWVYVHVPELPEVHTQGETLGQAREMVRDAIALVESVEIAA